jgi:hypothetical protein
MLQGSENAATRPSQQIAQPNNNIKGDNNVDANKVLTTEEETNKWQQGHQDFFAGSSSAHSGNADFPEQSSGMIRSRQTTKLAVARTF